MSKLGQLIGKAKKIKIGPEGKELEIEIKPVTVSDMDLMMELGNEKTRLVATKKLINKIIKDSVSDATDEEIEKLPVGYTTKIMETLMKVSGIESEKYNKDFLEEMKKKQHGKSV